MSLHSFPKALETAAPSDRGVPPLSVPVANLSVASSRDRVRTVVRVRCYSQALATVRYDRQGRAGFLNLGRYLAGWSSRILSSLRKFLQEPRGVLSVLFSPYLSVRFIHARKHGASDVEKIRFPSGEIRNVVG
jgi:hypothetical protein